MKFRSNVSRCSFLCFACQRASLAVLLCLAAAVAFSSFSAAQEPVPALPQVYIDTTWNPPTGTTWNVNGASGLQLALNLASPGDTVVLAAGAQFIGNFTLPEKSNPNGLWIYIESSALSLLPPPGTRVNPITDEANLAQIVTPNGSPAINIAAGANYYRLIGLEVYSNSNQGCFPHNVPRINCFSYELITPVWPLATLPNFITVDRSYVHGSPTQDVRQGINLNGTNMAVIESYISDIHQSTADSQGIIAYWTPGPIKIVDNYISATTEDIMFGGAGGYANPYVPSDIEIRQNHLFKPLSWRAPGITLPPHPQWTVKNNMEFKSAQRVLVNGNTLENNWMSGQTGSSVLFTVRTSQSGNVAVVDDITFENNVVTNVDAGFNTLETDNDCGAEWGYPNCTNPGESKRIVVYNNLLLLSPENNGAHHTGLSISSDWTDAVFQHNTVLMTDQSKCFSSIYFNANSTWHWPPAQSYTHNVWLLDNALCRQPTGDNGGQGTVGLNSYMGDPAPLAPRFYGNVMFVPSGDHVQSFPGTSNDPTTVPFTYVNSGQGNYQLLTPNWTNTTDGKISGIDWNELQEAMNGGMLQITSGSLPSGVVGNTYTTTLLAIGGTQPYTWSVTNGTLPTGLSLDPNSGIISGTPSASGTSSFTVTVTDSDNPPNTATANLSITVGPMSILNTSLPPGRIGQNYSATLSAAGGFPPLQWSVTNGSLPTGLILDPNAGLISGTPGVAGNFTFTITVSDSANPPNVANANLNIMISSSGGGIHP